MVECSVFAYNTTASSSTGVTPQYVWAPSNITYGLGLPHTACREENDVSLDGGHGGRKTMCLQEYVGSSRQKSKVERSDVQAVNTEYLGRMFSLVF